MRTQILGRLAVSSAIALTLWAGCAAPRGSIGQTSGTLPGAHVFRNATIREEIHAAQRLIESGESQVAVPRLLHTISKSPGAPAAVEAHYWLGVAYYNINSYRDAIDSFGDYLAQAPDGPYAESSRGYVETIRTEYAQRFDTAEELNTRIAELEQLRVAQPDNEQHLWELADLLWRRGDYAQSAAIYAGLALRNPEHRNDRRVTARLEWVGENQYVVLSPAEIQRRQIQERPLQIINTNSFRAGEDLFTRKARHYVVTGQVMNRGDSVLYGVQVLVTIYGFGNVVYDTNTITIGRLSPGEIRAFSVRFGNFDNIENIDRYECVPVFQ